MSATPYCPFAVQQPIDDWHSEPAIVPRVAVLHRHGSKGSSEAVGRYFDRVGSESHFSIKRDGTIVQFVPVDRQADAQWDANAFAVSIETEDDGIWEAAWTGAQIDAIVRLLFWLNAEWGIPLHECTGPYGSGVGWHKQFDQWNKSSHYCPSDGQVDQIRNHILPALSGDAPAYQPERGDEDVMRRGDQGQSVEYLQEQVNRMLTGRHDSGPLTIDGDFGPATESALKDAQSKWGWEPDGVATAAFMARTVHVVVETNVREWDRELRELIDGTRTIVETSSTSTGPDLQPILDRLDELEATAVRDVKVVR